MKTKMRIKTSLALLLTLVMLFSVMTPMMSFVASAIEVNLENVGSNTKLTSKTDYAVAPGITESHLITHNKDGSNQVQAYALEIDLSNPNVGLIASYKDYMNNLAPTSTWGMQTVRDQAIAAENYHKNTLNKPNFEIVGGINCDFFNMQTGAPLGSLVMNGVKYNETTSGGNSSYFAILDDGSAVIGSGAIPENAVEVVGGSVMLVQNGVVNPNIKGNLDKFPRTSIGLTADGKVILVTADGRQAPASCGQTFEENAQQMLALGCVTALQVDGGGSATLVSQREGETALSVRNSPSDGTERTVSTSLLVYSNATPDGEFDHANLAPVNNLYTPGSTISFSATGVDGSGAAAELPENGTFAIADETAGTIDPATGVFTAATDFTGDVTVNYMVGEAVKGSTTVSIVIPDALSVASTEQAVGPGVVTDFGIVAKYQDRDVIMNGGDIEWTIVDQSTNADLNGIAGTFNGLTFTGAEENAYNAKITAKLACNTDLAPLELTVFIGSKQISLYDFEYVTGEENKDNPKYIPSFNLPVNGAAWLKANGYNGYRGRALELQAEGHPLFMWPNGSISNDTVSTVVVDKADGEPVRFGDKSLRISFDFADYNKSQNGNFYLRTTANSMAFEGSPTAIGVWVYAPEGTANYHLYLNCASGMTVEAIEKGINHTQQSYQRLTPEDKANGILGINWTGWKYLEFDLTGTKGYTGTSNVGGSYEPYGLNPGAGVFWISYQPVHMGDDVTSDTIYIDDITLIYGANTSDTHNPEINYIGDLSEQIVDGETVYTSKTNTFKAQYADFEDKYMTGIDDTATKMYIDGVDVTDKCHIDTGNDEIYFYDAILPDGEHVIEIEVSDVFGNKTTQMKYFTIDSGAEDTEVSFVAANTPVLGEDFILDIVTNNAADIASADIEIKVLSAFTSYWRDVTVVPATGFKLDGEAVYNTIRDTLSFKVIKDEAATVAEDSDKIASIITKVPADTPENLEVTHRISKGAITYLSGESEAVTAFSGKLVSSCEAPLVIDIDTMIVGSTGGNIYVTDKDGNAVEGAEVYSGDVLLGTTDAEGKFFTDAFVDTVKEFSLTASKTDGENTLRSFTFKSQSYESKGDTSGLPSYIKLNATATPWNSQSVSWMANPLFTDAKAIVLYAEKADYDANGDATVFTELEGISYLSELNSSGSHLTNYTVRFNSATFTGLKENTEYVFKVSDGTTESEIKTFSTAKANTASDFFVIADIQNTSTEDIDRVNAALGNTGVTYDFGIHTGDIVDKAGDYAYWEAAGSAFSTGVLGTTDIFHTLGNHEYTGDFYAINAAHYFDLPGSKDAAPEAYSVEYGNIYIASFGFLGMTEYKAAVEWLREDIAKSDATWKILTVHQPPYYTNAGGATKGYRELITAAADELGLDFVFSGHDHAYARTQPITAGVPDAENGTVYILSGSVGGKGYDAINEPAHYYDKLVDYKDYDAIYMTVSVTDTEFAINTYDCKLDGTSILIDSYTATKTVDCTENGHDFAVNGEWLSCTVCNFTIPVEGYTGLVKDKETGRYMNIINGAPETSKWIEIEDSIYYLGEDGVAVAGEQTIGEFSYNFDEEGRLTEFAILEGDALVSNRWIDTADGIFYLGADGIAAKGETKIGEFTYPLDETGKLTKLAVVNDDEGKLMTNFWNTNPVSGKLVYHGADGLPVTGAHKIECTSDKYGKTNFTYTFDSEGDLIKGALVKEGKYFYYYIAGEKQRGWREIDGNWHYFDVIGPSGPGGIPSYAMATGKYPISREGSELNLVYTFDSNGRLVGGALTDTDYGKVLYWANSERLTGWYYIDEAIYFFGENYYAATGEQTIDDTAYTFDAEGRLQLKDENFALDGLFYYFDEDGKILTKHISDHPYIKAVDAPVAPQIGVDGLTEGEHCATCGYVRIKQEKVPALEDPNPPVVEPDPPVTEPDPPVTEPDPPKPPVVVDPTYRLGDSTRDGKITAEDARFALRVAAGLEKVTDSKTFVTMDVNFDGKINAIDARLILRFSAGIITEF